jgi:hypothetical protein
MPLYPDGFVIPRPRAQPFDQLRTELADLACDLERQGRLDAADIVMQIDGRVRELSGPANARLAEGGPVAADAMSCRPEPSLRIALPT